MCGNLGNLISSFLISSTRYTLTPGPIDSPSIALTAGVWPPQWSQYRRLKQENGMFQSSLGYMWPRVSRNDHGLGRWLSGKRCLQPTPMTSVWPPGPIEWQGKWTPVIGPLTSSLHHAHPHHHHHPNSGKPVWAIFKDGIDHSHGLAPPTRQDAAASLTERTSFLFVFKSNYSVSRKELTIKLPPIPRIKCQPYHLEPEEPTTILKSTQIQLRCFWLSQSYCKNQEIIINEYNSILIKRNYTRQSNNILYLWSSCCLWHDAEFKTYTLIYQTEQIKICQLIDSDLLKIAVTI